MIKARQMNKDFKMQVTDASGAVVYEGNSDRNFAHRWFNEHDRELGSEFMTGKHGKVKMVRKADGATILSLNLYEGMLDLATFNLRTRLK